ncbi:hypothetical protein SEA_WILLIAMSTRONG_51 [Microbacterium phage WilliamStrong]|nr:hypothetical protein SEA_WILLIAMSTRONG_51 [Microbacterium phage WilliamStrong]
MANNIKRWDIFRYNGVEVEVIAVDPDPTAMVMVVRRDNPDVALYVARTSLVAL